MILDQERVQEVQEYAEAIQNEQILFSRLNGITASESERDLALNEAILAIEVSDRIELKYGIQRDQTFMILKKKDDDSLIP